MSLAEDLRQLQEMYDSGALTDEEFTQAKAAVLRGAPLVQPPASQPRPPLFPLDPTEGLTPGNLRVMQIIATAILLGDLFFLGIVLFLVLVQNNGQGMTPPAGFPAVSFVAGVLLAVNAPLAFILPGIMTRSALRRILAGTWPVPQGMPPGPYASGGAMLVAVRLTTLIMGLAMLEGAAITGSLAYLVEAHPLGLGVVCVATILMLGKFPTEQRVRAWLEKQGEALTELHQQQDLASLG